MFLQPSSSHRKQEGLQPPRNPALLQTCACAIFHSVYFGLYYQLATKHKPNDWNSYVHCVLVTDLSRYAQNFLAACGSSLAGSLFLQFTDSVQRVMYTILEENHRQKHLSQDTRFTSVLKQSWIEDRLRVHYKFHVGHLLSQSTSAALILFCFDIMMKQADIQLENQKNQQIEHQQTQLSNKEVIWDDELETSESNEDLTHPLPM